MQSDRIAPIINPNKQNPCLAVIGEIVGEGADSLPYSVTI